jgi:gamma-D-glutamyl-L-lysine dipeptidyl-peptidase
MTLTLVSTGVSPLWRGSTGSARDDRVTEVLAGEPVARTGRESDGRVEVVAPWQPSSLHQDGYPGWLDAGHLGPEVDSEPSLGVDLEALAGGSGDAVEVARRLLGTPYVWGGLSPGGIDCSGLVHLVLRRLGRMVPRDARDQAAALPPVALEGVRRGDLYFFARPGRPVHHVGLVVEPGVLVHASDSDGGVVEGPLDVDRRGTLVSAGRLPLDLP